jgi:uncharacterized protein YkwD
MALDYVDGKVRAGKKCPPTRRRSAAGGGKNQETLMNHWLQRLGLLVLFGAAGLFHVTADEPKEKPRPKEQPKFKLSAEEQELMQRVNKEREKEKLPPLKPNPTLFEVARAHAANMAKQGKAEHVLDGKDQYKRIKEAGYRYYWAGENVARTKNATLADVVEGWMNSKLHREDILFDKFTETGLGIAPGDKEWVYYVQVFALPRGKD